MLLELGSQLGEELLLKVEQDGEVKELKFVSAKGFYPSRVPPYLSSLCPDFLYLSIAFPIFPFGALPLLQPLF